MSGHRPTLAQVLDAAIAQGLAGLRVSLPGEIVKFDSIKQTAQVKALIADQFFDAEGHSQIVTLPIINSVPVQFAGGGGFAATWPVAAGDPCLLVFSDRSLDNWFARGGETDPDDERRHDLSDAVAILGVRSDPGSLTDFDTARAVWGNKGPRIAADGTTLHLGVDHNEAAAQSVLRGNLFLDQLGTFLDAVDSASTTAGNALNAAGAGIEGAAPLNAILYVGGALASPGFAAAGAALNSGGAALLALKAVITAFKAQFTEIRSEKVKLP